MALHLFGPRFEDPTPRAAGLPAELWWRLAWMGAAWLVLLHLCRYVWVDEEV